MLTVLGMYQVLHPHIVLKEEVRKALKLLAEDLSRLGRFTTQAEEPI